MYVCMTLLFYTIRTAADGKKKKEKKADYIGSSWPARLFSSQTSRNTLPPYFVNVLSEGGDKSAAEDLHRRHPNNNLYEFPTL